MSTYYTKCGKTFTKSTKATTTGYELALKENGEAEEYSESIGEQDCPACPFKVKVTDWPDKFKRWECRAGSKKPNHKNDWRGSLDDKCTLHIQSLHHDFLESVIEYCKAQPDLSASYNGTDEADCRRSVSISCSANKAGIAAKKVLIEKFFPPEPENLFREAGGEDCAVEPRAYDPEPMPEEMRPEGYDANNNHCSENECPFHDFDGHECSFDEPKDEEAFSDTADAVEHYNCKNPVVLKFYNQKCRVCGCTNFHACEGGCYWVEDDLCSKCASKEEPKTWHPRCPYLSSMGFDHIECTLHSRARDKKEFDNSKACDEYTEKYCDLGFDQCPTYQMIYQEEISSTDVHILDYRKCAFCCNHTGYTGLKKSEDGSKVGFCQIKQKAVDNFNSETVCEWFNRKKDSTSNEAQKEDKEAVAHVLHDGRLKCPYLGEVSRKDLNVHCGDNFNFSFKSRPVNGKQADIGQDLQNLEQHLEKCRTHPIDCRPFLFRELEKAGEKPQSDWSNEDLRNRYDELKGDKQVMKNDIQEQDMVPATGTQLQAFDYASVDQETAGFLQVKAFRIGKITGQAYTLIGKEMKEAQERLSQHGYGCFEEWFNSLGFKRDTVYRLVQRYDLIVANCDKRELIEELPVSLSYEIAKPSASQEGKDKVLAGDITTHKEYQELMRQNRVLELRAKGADDQAKQLDIKTREVEQRLTAQRDNTRAKEQEIASLKQQIAQAKVNGSTDKVRELGAKIKEKQEEIDNYQGEIGRLNVKLAAKDAEIAAKERKLKDKPIEVPAVRVEEKEVIPGDIANIICGRVESLLQGISNLTEQEMKIYLEYSSYKGTSLQILENAKSKLRQLTMLTADKKQAS